MAKKKAPEEAGGGAGWLATYSDMMTLLMCFFVLLFAMSVVDAEKFSQLAASLSNAPRTINIMAGGMGEGMTEKLGNGIIEMPMIERIDSVNTFDNKGEESDFKRLAAEFKSYFADSEAGGQIIIVEDPRDESINITFGDGILFDSGSVEIKLEGREALDFIANELIKFPGMLIEIEGHPDNIPMRNSAAYPDNWHLSAGRAISVGQFLINQKGFSPRQVSAIGRGEHMPKVPNDTELNRARNRRVEIKIRQADDVDSMALY